MHDSIDVAVPDGVCGDWRVESFTVTEEDAKLTKLRAAINGSDQYVPPGTYKRLMRGGTVVMSNAEVSGADTASAGLPGYAGDNKGE